jgi:hypothetical protein
MRAWPAILIFLPLAAQETAPSAKETAPAIQAAPAAPAAPAAQEKKPAPTAQETKPAAAETNAAQETKPAVTETKPAAAKTAPAAPEALASAPRTEPGLTGSVDVGYRWRTGVGGSLDTYRSVVNLGEGPKLFGLDLSFQSATRRWFDRVGVRANNWGGDPYNTAHVDATRHAGTTSTSITGTSRITISCPRLPIRPSARVSFSTSARTTHAGG